MRRFILLLATIAFFAFPLASAADEAPISEATQECLDCHESLHPGIVSGWKKSRHARFTPEQSMKSPALTRRVSAKAVPDSYAKVAVGCAECHTQRQMSHKDSFEHNGYQVHPIVSPKDCATCHKVEEGGYQNNIMAHAYANLVENPVYDMLGQAINGSPEVNGTDLGFAKSDPQTEMSSCLHCHGTKVEVEGMETRSTPLGEMEFPQLRGWPNQGVGRVNPDGSIGACSACHFRHSFSIAMARKPYTCKECHNGPDVPAYKVYSASKHGNYFSGSWDKWDFEPVPWVVGRDFQAPTCAACHVSLISNEEGEVVAHRSHQMTDRLPYRIFGIIYATPQPISPKTYLIRNAEGQPLPATLDGKNATKYLIPRDEQTRRRDRMQKICLSCHDRSWVDGHWKRFENSIATTNHEVRAGTELISRAWAKGWAKGLPDNPFDEFVERTWVDIWLFYCNNVRFTSAMAAGGDYGVFADGRYWSAKRLSQIHDWLKTQERINSAK